LSIKNCVIQIMTLKIYIHIPGTMQNRTCSYSMLKLVSFHIQAHLNAFLQILEYFSQSVDIDGLNLLASLRSIVRGVFLSILPFSRPQRKKLVCVRPGYLGGQRFFEIILSLKKLSISRMLAFEM
jgi:hypothetical protein